MVSTDKQRTPNTGLAKVAVQCSADTFVVNQSLVLRINICGENRHLRQARNRYKFQDKRTSSITVQGSVSEEPYFSPFSRLAQSPSAVRSQS
jgi:hypothetical protein